MTSMNKPCVILNINLIDPWMMGLKTYLATK